MRNTNYVALIFNGSSYLCIQRIIFVNEDYKLIERNPFIVGDRVFLKPSTKKCDEDWSGPHTVTKINSAVSCEINDDGVCRHVSFLRLVPKARERNINDEELICENSFELDVSDTNSRPKRQIKKPKWHDDYIFDNV